MTKYISSKSYRTVGKSAYHSDQECRYVGENHRPVPDDHPIVEELEECTDCAGETPEAPSMESTCPFCGESVRRLPPHLPCEESA